MTKQELRAECKKRRAAIPAEGKKKLDELIRRRIVETAEFQQAETVLLYAPVKGEIDLLPLVSICRRMGKEVGFPVSMSDGSLMFRSPTAEEKPISGAYGIPEPPPTAKVSTLNQKTLCILPGLSFDANGNRLGYGKGYYDRFLSDFTGMTLGAVYEKLMMEQIPSEEHDRRADVIVHEKGVLQLTDKTPKSTANTPSYRDRVKKRVESFLYQKLEPARNLIHRQLHPDQAPTAETAPIRPQTWAPILVLSTFLLLILSRFIDTALARRDGEYVAVVLLQVFIFILPAILYIQLRGESFPKRIRMHPIRPEHLWFCGCMLVVMITFGLLISILTGGISSLNGNFTLYDTFIARTNGSAWELVYIVLAYALLPAFCEETVYRSILCAEYESMGTGVSVTVSALFFAMLHFSFPNFLNYFILGIILASVMYTTRSAFAPMLLHLLYNLFCLFGQPYLSAFYVNAGSSEIFMFCLIVLLLLFAAFATGEARKIYHLYAKANLSSDYTVSVRLADYPKRIFNALKTPTVVIIFLLWLVMAIADLFV